MNLRQELEKRGFVYQFSDEKLFDIYDQGNQSFYFGMDPTADSLHLGNLVNFMSAINFMKRGNKLYLMVGGATGMIGDPGGKDGEREFLDEKTLQHNVDCITIQVTKITKHLEELSGFKFDFEVVNNYDFYKDMSVLEFLRKAGKNITINQMMNKETVKKRINDPEKSISYTEFSYMLLQGYDFYKLFTEKDVLLQLSGSDQWGNSITGVEMIRKMEDKSAYVLTCPLILASNGKKFGKSEGNAIWLDPSKNSPYFVYQYFMNSSDDDVERFLKLFSLLEFNEINDIITKHAQEPEIRYGQRLLANYVVQTVFGKKASLQAEKISELLFGGGDKIELLNGMDDEDISALMEETGGEKIGESNGLLDILVQLGLSQSKGQARKDIKANSISINEEKVTDMEYVLLDTDFVSGKFVLIRKGKKNYKLLIK